MVEPATNSSSPIVPQPTGLPGPMLSQASISQIPSAGLTTAPVASNFTSPLSVGGTLSNSPQQPKSIEELSLIQIPSQNPTSISAPSGDTGPSPAQLVTNSSLSSPQLQSDPTNIASYDESALQSNIDIPIEFVDGVAPPEKPQPAEALQEVLQAEVSPLPVVTQAEIFPAVASQTTASTIASEAIADQSVTGESGAVANSQPEPAVLEVASNDSPQPVSEVSEPIQNQPQTPSVPGETTPLKTVDALSDVVSQQSRSEPSEESGSSQETVSEPKVADSPAQVIKAPKTQVSSILDILVEKKLITLEEANKILTKSVQTGVTAEKIVESERVVGEDDLARARSDYYGIPYVDLNQIGVYPEALSQVPEAVARSYWVLPFVVDKEAKKLSVAMRNPLDVQAIDFLEHKTGYKILAHFASSSELERIIAEQYSQGLSSEVTQALEQTKQIQQQKASEQDFTELSGGVVRQAPITKIVQTILSFSLKARASDIHIEPQETRTRVRYRIDGILQEKLILPKSVHQAVVSRIKILSSLKIDERRLPQDGRFDFSENGQQVDLRISTLPTIHGEKVVMRLLKKNAEVPSLEQLGLTDLALRNVQDAIKVPHGIILVTGPTGSGKTTTLYSVLHTINTPKVNIMTLEDPVEYQMTGVNQVQINPQAGLTFASGLRSFLRQDPNIIMVGEIRDSETAGLAVQASLTGHLVFSTLHTSSAAGALPRLMDMGAEPFLLASSMTCVLAQRIARVINPEYKEAYKPEKAVLEDIKRTLGDHFTRWLSQRQISESEIELMRPSKDRPESEPDFKGRIAIFEVMKISEEIAKMIITRQPASDMEKASLREGMLLMKQDGYIKVLEGHTTVEEVLRVAEI